MSTPARQIIAMGGGTLDPAKPLLERYVLAQTRKRKPSICFLPTATGDSDVYIENFYRVFRALPCQPGHMSVFRRTPDLEAVLLTQDVIYVGGGNTKSMLAVWRDWDLPRILRRAWTKGIVLAGVSAGAICWFDMSITDSWADRLRPLPCLGWLRGTCCPHFDGEPERRPTLHQLVATGKVPKALALDDGAAAHFIGRRLARVVTDRAGAGAYEVRRVGSRSVETALDVVSLGRKRPPTPNPAVSAARTPRAGPATTHGSAI